MRNSTKIVSAGRKGNRTRITIKDVAESLGMSKSTVSRALNGYPDIAESTRLNVKRAAYRMGYKPMVHAQAIRTGLVRSIGLVLNADSHDGHRPFLADFIDGISRRASEENWTLTVSTAPHSLGVISTIERLIDEHTVDGFILPRTRVIDPRVKFLRKMQMPFIMFGRTGDAEGCGWYDVKGEEAMEQAVLRLAAFGHRRIGFINGLERYMYAKLRLEGFRSGMQKAGLELDEDYIRHGAINQLQGESQGAELLDLPNPPTAIVCALDLAALGLYRAAAARGLQIGSNLSIIAYDGLAEGAMASPPLTTYGVDSREAGRHLADLLIKRIRGDAPETLRLLGEAKLIERASDGPPVAHIHSIQANS